MNLFMFTEDQSNAKKRRKMLECWHAHGGIMLMGCGYLCLRVGHGSASPSGCSYGRLLLRMAWAVRAHWSRVERAGGVCICNNCSYEMYRNLVLETKQQEYKYSHRESKAFITTLQSPGPDVLVCDVLPLSTEPTSNHNAIRMYHVSYKCSDRSGMVWVCGCGCRCATRRIF